MVLNYSDMSLQTEVPIVPERYANMSFPIRAFIFDGSYCEGRLEWNSKIAGSNMSRETGIVVKSAAACR